ncbi:MULTISPECIES: dethiobiotin synthase [Deefgea]|uniref:ATP-dependent dethiobiotin synthetase BioD n=1 Tax=Deefgea chitinilytica TaxID=570276 RepID=A0ABS2C9F9_9NEIS|nr:MULTISPECIES: dethiobiotin synthase [Deefgea]MBM5570768.1 dethiobiotin synthase [Deefgea chitinilytica]MBM9887997.1 dethiobiotin synthase [Deefgea sp. CFH1-16]
MALRFFITGTDTDIGKTVASAQLIRGFAQMGYKTIGMKPVASGCERSNDILLNVDVASHCRASNISAPLDLINPYRFVPAISPHLAARDANVEIHISHLVDCAEQLSNLAEVVIIEGAGGWYAPISDQNTIADLATALAAPVIMVVGMRLGCLNHAQLTIDAIEQRGLIVAGWIANCIDPAFDRYEDNLAYLKKHISAPLLAELAYDEGAVNFALNASAIELLTANLAINQPIIAESHI